MLTELSLSNRENSPLDDDMISFFSHVVENPFDYVFDELYARLMIWPIAGSYSEDVSLHLHLDLELVTQEPCERVTVPMEFLALDLYHQPHAQMLMFDMRSSAV